MQTHLAMRVRSGYCAALQDSSAGQQQQPQQLEQVVTDYASVAAVTVALKQLAACARACSDSARSALMSHIAAYVYDKCGAPRQAAALLLAGPASSTRYNGTAGDSLLWGLIPRQQADADNVARMLSEGGEWHAAAFVAQLQAQVLAAQLKSASATERTALLLRLEDRLRQAAVACTFIASLPELPPRFFAVRPLGTAWPAELTDRLHVLSAPQTVSLGDTVAALQAAFPSAVMLTPASPPEPRPTALCRSFH